MIDPRVAAASIHMFIDFDCVIDFDCGDNVSCTGGEEER
jgi:hypothetical protein